MLVLTDAEYNVLIDVAVPVVIAVVVTAYGSCELLTEYDVAVVEGIREVERLVEVLVYVLVPIARVLR